MNRSTNGCWTCKIRHRKCDETRPVCRECSTRGLNCHGYGEKPQWISDPIALNSELARIKTLIKSGRHRGKEPKSLSTCQNSGNVGGFAGTGSSQSHLNVCLSMRESELLIYYLDYVFPLQFPYYSGHVEFGGRGWLFWLLMKNMPLQQAAFTLSALHQFEKGATEDKRLEQELLEYHIRALRGLQDSLCPLQTDLHVTDKERVVEFMACSLWLISFEVFQGGSGNWQAHLEAINDLVGKITTRGDASPRRNNNTLHESTALLEHAEKFCIANSIWFDILSCASTGKCPKAHFKAWLDEEYIDMSQIMGCHSWVMAVIGDISTITSGVPSDSVERRDLEALEQRLTDGIARLRLQLDETRLPPLCDRLSLVFATAALVVLYVFPSDVGGSGSKIYDAVEATMDALRSVPSYVSRRGLVWPICIAGSMADVDQQSFFDVILIEVLQEADSEFGNCGTILRILKRCWFLRQQSNGDRYHWLDAMAELETYTLLV